MTLLRNGFPPVVCGARADAVVVDSVPRAENGLVALRFNCTGSDAVEERDDAEDRDDIDGRVGAGDDSGTAPRVDALFANGFLGSDADGPVFMLTSMLCRNGLLTVLARCRDCGCCSCSCGCRCCSCC